MHASMVLSLVVPALLKKSPLVNCIVVKLHSSEACGGGGKEDYKDLPV